MISPSHFLQVNFLEVITVNKPRLPYMLIQNHKHRYGKRARGGLRGIWDFLTKMRLRIFGSHLIYPSIPLGQKIELYLILFNS